MCSYRGFFRNEMKQDKSIEGESFLNKFFKKIKSFLFYGINTKQINELFSSFQENLKERKVFLKDGNAGAHAANWLILQMQ